MIRANTSNRDTLSGCLVCCCILMLMTILAGTHAHAGTPASQKMIDSPELFAPLDNLPGRKVNHEYLPTVDTQSSEPICIPFNIVYYCVTWLKAKEHGWLHPNRFTHPERVMDPHFTIKTTSLETSLINHGCATYADTAAGFNPADWPTRAQWEAALLNRVESYDVLSITTDDDVRAMKAYLANGSIGLTGLNSTPAFQAYGSTPEPAVVNQEVFFKYDSLNGVGHAITLIGYDDNKTWVDGESVTHQGAFLCVNSWGQDWGVSVPEVGTRGFVWLSYEFFRDSISHTTIFINRPEEQPKALAVIEIDHPDSAQTSVQIQSDWPYIPGRPQESRWTMNYSPGIPYKAIKTQMVIDVTDAYEMGARSFWLRVRNADFMSNGEPKTGTIPYFALELPGAPEPWECLQTPARMIPLGSLSDPEFLWLSVGLIEDEGPIQEGIAVDGAQFFWGDFGGNGQPFGVVHGMALVDGEFPGRTYLLFPKDDGSLRLKPLDFTDIYSFFASGDLNNDGMMDLVTTPVFDEGPLQAWRYSPYDEKFIPMNEVTLPDVRIGEGEMALIDFNNDGRLDLATYAREFDDEAPIAFRIWLQQPGGSFTDSGIRIPYNQYIYKARMAWADIDGDGWLDVALPAMAEFYNDFYDEYYDSPCTVFLRNTGGTGLEEYARTSGEALPEGNMAFGDANNDGRPDLALAGRNILCINRGGGVFEEKTFGLNLWNDAWVGWADMNNDGFSDLLYCGDQGQVRNHYNAIMLNNGDETFSLAVGTLPGFWHGAMAPADIDGDGDVDLIGAGMIEEYALWDYERSLRLFRNRTAQAAGYGRVNQPPQVPRGLQASRDGGRMTLRWDPATDDLTPTSAMQYNVRLDTFPGWNNFMSGLGTSSLAANCSLARLGGQTGAIFDGTPATPFYCSVQAVDGAGAHSAWSEPLLVSQDGSADACDTNRDGRVDVADLVTIKQLEMGQTAPEAAQGDVNADGKVDMMDQRYVVNRMMGMDAPGRDVVVMRTIGADGGELAADGFSLQIPAGALSKPTIMTLHKTDVDRPTGDQSVSPMYHLKGLPEAGLPSFTLRLRADRPMSGETLLAFGLEGWRTSEASTGRGFYYIRPSQIDGDWLTFVVPEVAGTNQGAQPGLDATIEWGVVDGWFGMASGLATGESEHFMTVYPSGHDAVAVSQLIDALEDAYKALKDDVSFVYFYMPSGKIQVEVKDRGPNEYGSFLNLPGRAFDKLEFNTKDIVRGSNVVRATAYHEFMHVVQSQHFSSVNSSLYWLDEAGAVWAETLGNPGSVPSVYDYNAAEVMRGLIAGASPDPEAHGYGLAPLFTYLTDYKKRAWAPWSVWSWIHGGHSIVEAIQFAANTEDMLWYTEFLQAHVEGKLLAYNTMDINRDAPADRTLDLEAVDTDFPQKFSGSISDLSGKLFQTKLGTANLPADAVISHRLVAPEYIDLTCFKHTQPVATGQLGMGVKTAVAVKFDAPLNDCNFDGKEKILTLLSNREGNAGKGYKGLSNYELIIAPTWDRQYVFPSSSARNGGVYGGIPSFSVEGSLEGPGLTGVYMDTIEDYDYYHSSIGPVVSAQAIGEPPLELTLDLDVTLVSSSATEGIHVYTVSGIDHYRLNYYEDKDFSVAKTMVSDDGIFQITFRPDQTLFSGVIYVVYDVTVDVYNYEGDLTSTYIDAGRTTPAGAVYIEP